MDTRGGFPPGEQERADILRFLAFQVARGSDIRSGLFQLMNHGIRMGENDQTLPAPPKSFVQRRHLQVLGSAAETAFKGIWWRTWRIVEFERPSLVTSDTPVAPVSRGYGPVGMINAEWIFFPLDPMRALILAAENHVEKVVRGTQDAADFINHCVAEQAHRWIYHRPQQSPMSRLSLPPKEPRVLSRVGEGERYFARDEAVINLKNSVMVTPYPMERPTITDEVLAVLRGQTQDY